MKLPKEFNMHRINDYLMSRNCGLTHAQKVVAYHCIHLDYGRQKSGKFWKGAGAIATDLDCDRKTVHSTWNIMKRKGWITDTGKRNGRAIVWRIEYIALWNDSHLKGNDSPLIAHSFPHEGEPVGTNPPKEASEVNSPNEFTEEADLTESVSTSPSLVDTTTTKPLSAKDLIAESQALTGAALKQRLAFFKKIDDQNIWCEDDE